MKKFLSWFENLFSIKNDISYYTVDGGILAPYPDMTDEDLKDFEQSLKVPSSF